MKKIIEAIIALIMMGILPVGCDEIPTTTTTGVTTSHLSTTSAETTTRVTTTHTTDTTSTTVTDAAPALAFELDEDVYTDGGAGLEAVADLFGATFVAVRVDGDVIAVNDYVLSGNTLSLEAEFLSGLAFGAHELALSTSGGTATAAFVCNDVPTISAKTDFVKYPGETVADEDFTGLVNDVVGTRTYAYELSAGTGILTDHGDGTFAYVPGDILAGTALITFSVTDQYGATASRDVTLTYKTVDPAAIDDQTFDLDTPADVEITVDENGDEPVSFPVDLVGVAGHAITPDDYVLNDGTATVTILSAFLGTLLPGEYAFVVTTTAGERAFTLSVVANPAVEIQGDGVVTTGAETDVVILLDLKGATFTGIDYEALPLDAAAYDYLDGVLTIDSAWLATQAVGVHEFVLKSSAGETSFSLLKNDVPTIVDKTDFIKLPGEAITEEDFRDLVANTVGTVTVAYVKKSGAGVLTDHLDGTFDFIPDTVYAGEVVITVTATDEYGASAQNDVTLTYKTVDPIIYDAGGSKIVDKVGAFQDVVMTVDTFGTESSSLYYEMTDVLLDGISVGASNVVFRVSGNARFFSVKATYLMTVAPGVRTFTLVTTAGQANFLIDVRDSRAVASDITAIDHVRTVDTAAPTFAITPYAHVLDAADFTIVGVAWIAGTDFLYADDTLIVDPAFLDLRDAGDYVILVEGVALITISVKNPTAPTVSPSDAVVTIEKAAISADLTIACALYGLEAETLLTWGGFDVAIDAYIVALDGITLRQAFLGSLPYGSHVFTILNSNGSDTFELRVSDLPVANAGSQNVTKFTYETISAEAFRVTAKDSWGIASYVFTGAACYDYATATGGVPDPAAVGPDGKSLTGAFGTITIDDGTDAFAFARAPGWFGIVVFEYVATDGAGIESESIQMEIVYLETAPAIADATVKTFLAGGGDVVFSITNASGNSFFPVWKLFLGATELVLDADYTVGPQNGGTLYFNVTKTFLETLAYGAHSFTLYTEGGNADFTITVLGAPATLDADGAFNMGNPADVTFMITGYPLSTMTFTHGGAELDPLFYTFAGGVLTVKAGYLAIQAYGDVVIRAQNASGTLDLLITVADSRDCVLGAGPFDYTEHSFVGVDVPLTLYDGVLVHVKYGETILGSPAYVYADGVLSLDGDYLETLLGSVTEFIFTVVTSKNTLTLTIAVTPFTVLPEALLLSDGYRIDVPEDVSYGIDLNGNVFQDVSAGTTTLLSETDYVFDAETGILTLKASFLMTRDHSAGSIAVVIRTADENDLGVNIPLDHAENRVENGGFETGDLTGWTSFSLWKAESGMIAWTADRVVSGTYFDQNYVYNRDGAYNLGIYGGAINKDSGQERMGYLRSSDFTLGGSGWIAFKLGGGKNDAFAYVAIRRTSDDVEIARIGNRNFNNTTLSGTLNAEAYLFQYYYDLASVGAIGESYYLVIADTMSNEWCVLSADSFATYLASAPVTNADNLATNVVPTILGTGTATNEIKNGYFNSGLDSWSNPDGVFQIQDGFAISSVGGDGATGVLRSSAFTVVGMKYLRLDWAGALRYDKQVCISIREVGTNIEVLRFVRRDNLSTKADGNFDNHMLDLTSLDETKLYYLEIVDNVNAGWGVAKIDAIRFVTLTEWNAVVTGDRAVSVSGLPLDFDLPL